MNVSPWQVFVDEMYDRFGRRDPDCFWCGETVYMSLQGFFSGGRWTTEKDLEGLGTAADRGVRCAASPDDEHDVLV